MASRIKTLTFVLAAAILPLLIQPVYADLDFEKRCDTISTKFCFTSFIWCDIANSDECYYSENEYPMESPQSSKAGVLWSQEYTLTWARTDPEYPVLIRWNVFPRDSSSESIAWERNFTEGEKSFSFKFSDLAYDIDDVDGIEVKGHASGLSNRFNIFQPGRPYDVFEGDDSGQFAVLDDTARDFLATQRELGEDDMYDTWKLGVGIGVGLCVPFFMAVSFIGGLIVGKRRKTLVKEHKSVGD